MVNQALTLEIISKYAGNRFDLVQAGGGNSSVKNSNTCEMLIKASGIALSEVTEINGYVSVDYQLIRKVLGGGGFVGLNKKQREAVAEKAMSSAKISETGKPSIETFLHALLDTYTLHTHPVSVNILTSRENWAKELIAIWPEAICVPYHTPGIDLALALAAEIKIYVADYGTRPKVIFLQNHGLIVSCADKQEVMDLTDRVTLAIETDLNIDLSRYRNVAQIQSIFNQAGYSQISLMCNDDSVIKNAMMTENKNIEIWPFCPDTFIYCGARPVFLRDENDVQSITDYVVKFRDFPNVLVLHTQVYFCATNLRKAKDCQDLFKFHLLVSSQNRELTQRISLDEIAYLSNWDAEKYRQEV
jgi:rhamnose utilization protein RhaD (predicted bifunctional aldolase and dehydrogenase)